MEDIVASADWSDRTYYLYEGRPERYETSLEFEGHLWQTCLSRPDKWRTEHCSRSTPAIISPLCLRISEVTDPDEKRYTITQVNEYDVSENAGEQNGNSLSRF